VKLQDLLNLETFTTWANAQIEKAEHGQATSQASHQFGLCGIRQFGDALLGGIFLFANNFDAACEENALQDADGNIWPLRPESNMVIRDGRGPQEQ
jgi:hypothetical protein